MNTLVLSMVSQNILNYAQPILNNQQNYAHHYNLHYQCAFVPVPPFESHHPSYSKIPLLSHFLQQYDDVLYLDADACFTNFTIDFRHLIPDHAQIAITPSRHNNQISFGPGIMYWKSTPHTKKFLNTWQMATLQNPKKEHPWEQYHLNQLHHNGIINESLSICPIQLEQFVFHNNPTKTWKPGDLIAHINPWICCNPPNLSTNWSNVWQKRNLIFRYAIEPNIVNCTLKKSLNKISIISSHISHECPHPYRRIALPPCPYHRCNPECRRN